MADPLDPAALRKVAERALDRWADETEAGILARGCIALLDREDAARADALLLADGEDLEGFDAHVLACAGPVPGQVETPEQG